MNWNQTDEEGVWDRDVIDFFFLWNPHKKHVYLGLCFMRIVSLKKPTTSLIQTHTEEGKRSWCTFYIESQCTNKPSYVRLNTIKCSSFARGGGMNQQTTIAKTVLIIWHLC